MSEQCSKRIWPSGGFHSYQCSKTGKVEHRGKWFCGIHSPEAEKRRQDKWDEKSRRLNAEWDAKRAKDARRNACEAAFEGIPTEAITSGLVGEMAQKASAFLEAMSLGPLEAAAQFGPDFDLVAHSEKTADELRALLKQIGKE